VTRGDVYRVRLPRRRGHEQHEPRYVVLIQADELLALSTVLVGPYFPKRAGGELPARD
jgi:mRNA-degrading endonuclease toxin of MazEF toxin-antitoxin module